MKIMMTLLMFLVLFGPTASTQEYTQWNLPEGAIARLGKGKIEAIQYSPDGTLLAVGSPMGLWLYDGTTYQEITLIRGDVSSKGVAFSPDGRLLAGSGGVISSTVLFWDTITGQQIQQHNEHTGSLTSLTFSPNGGTLASAGDDGTVLLWKVH